MNKKEDARLRHPLYILYSHNLDQLNGLSPKGLWNGVLFDFNDPARMSGVGGGGGDHISAEIVLSITILVIFGLVYGLLFTNQNY